MNSVLEGELLGKARLAAAFFELLETVPYEKIIVSEICQRAQVTRQTFYRHFENKQSVAVWYFKEEAARSMFRVGRELSWHDSLLEVVRLAQQSRIHRDLFRGDEYDSVKMHACRCREETLRQTILDFQPEKLTETVEFQIRFFARAEVESMANGEHSPQQLAELIESCIPAELHQIIDSIYDLNHQREI